MSEIILTWSCVWIDALVDKKMCDKQASSKTNQKKFLHRLVENLLEPINIDS